MNLDLHAPRWFELKFYGKEDKLQEAWDRYKLKIFEEDCKEMIERFNPIKWADAILMRRA